MLTIQECLTVSSLKGAVVGMLTPQNLVNAAVNQGFIFPPLELVYQSPLIQRKEPSLGQGGSLRRDFSGNYKMKGDPIVCKGNHQIGEKYYLSYGRCH